MVTRRKTRQSTNVFHMLTKEQLVHLREAFNLMDVDSDSKLSVEDMTTFLASIGSPFSEEDIKEMVEELEPNPTFMILLTCIGERLSEISPEKDICEWLKIFDEDNDGYVETEFLRQWMTEKGEFLTPEDFDYLIRGCEELGRIDYRKLASKIKHGEIIESLNE